MILNQIKSKYVYAYLLVVNEKLVKKCFNMLLQTVINKDQFWSKQVCIKAMFGGDCSTKRNGDELSFFLSI